MFWSFPNETLQKQKYATLSRKGIPGYYGMERYRTKTQLLAYLYRSEKELWRTLMDDGLLWLKWNEIRIKLERVLLIFERWTEALRLEIADKHQQLSDIQTFWIAFVKKSNVKHTQTLLEVS